MNVNLKTSCAAITLLLFLGVAVTPVSAAVVWSDDFEDGNYDGWTSAWDIWEVVDGILQRSNGVALFGAYIYHESTVANGTWSLDMVHIIDATEEIWFMGDGPGWGYNVKIDDTNIRLGWRLDEMIGQMDTCETDIAGWQHIDITRDLAGEFNVWLNDTHVMQGVHTEASTSANFTIYMAHPGGLDNVTVSDTVDKVCTDETCEVCQTTTTTTTTTPTTTTTTSTTTTTTTTTTPGIPMELLLVGIAVPVVIIVIVVAMKVRK